ncbi:MAG TPA: ankyrin repeat domain-containing protein [Tepidisphaeraceae bacterium]|jgi:ankyrin repeat protein
MATVEHRNSARGISRIMPALARSRNAKRLDSELIEGSLEGDIERVQNLLTAGADVNARNRRGETPISAAAAWNHLGIVKLLLKHDADPNLADVAGGSPLMWAALHGSKVIVRELLRHGADVNAADKSGNTVLMHALWRDDTDQMPGIVAELMKYRPNVTATNQRGEMAQSIARQRGFEELLRLEVRRQNVRRVFPSSRLKSKPERA